MLASAGRQRIELAGFRVYSSKDSGLAQSLHDLVAPRLEVRQRWFAAVWADVEILPGEQWRSEIANALSRCQFALLFVTADFLASEFIQCYEIPRLVADDKVLLPLLLEPVDLNNVKLGLLDGLQVHGYRVAPGQNLSFAECTTAAERCGFADAVVTELEGRLLKESVIK